MAERLVDRLLSTAQQNLGIYAGSRERCADTVREVFSKAGIPIGVTSKPWDGQAPGPRMADGFFGDDQGRRIDRREDLQPGDLVGFDQTYGNYGRGVQTHVGIYAGNGMMYDHSSRGGLVSRPLSTFGGFMYGMRPKAFEADGVSQAGSDALERVNAFDQATAAAGPGGNGGAPPAAPFSSNPRDAAYWQREDIKQWASSHQDLAAQAMARYGVSPQQGG
jgi:hypothetical protein